MAAAVDGTKWCPKCERTLEVSAFNKSAQKKDGLKVWCRECCNATERQRYADKTPDEKAVLHAKHREWLEAHPDDQRAFVRAWQRRNPEANKASNARWRAANPEIVAVWNKSNHARRKGAPGKYTKADVDDLMSDQEG